MISTAIPPLVIAAVACLAAGLRVAIDDRPLRRLQEPPLASDLAINYDDAVARTGGRVRDVGDLQEIIAIDTIDARGLYLHPAREALTNAPGGPMLVLGNRAVFDLRRGAEPSSPLVRRIDR